MIETTDTYEGKVTIVQNDKRIPAECQYYAEQEVIHVGGSTVPGLQTWQGTLYLSQPIDLSEATLELPDGSTGNILIHSIETMVTISMGNTWLPQAHFAGTGPAPSRDNR